MPLRLSITLALLTGVLFGQNSQPMRQGFVIPQGLTISLLTASSDVLTFEPIQIAIKVSNATETAITFTGSNEAFTSVRSSGVERQYTPEGVPLLVPEIPHEITFKAHAGKYFTTFIDFDGLQHGTSVTGHEGVLEIIVHVFGLSSPTLRMAVHRPTGVDAEALDWLRQWRLEKFLATDAYERYSADQSVVHMLKEFKKAFPGSKYSAYAGLALAGIVSNEVESKQEVEGLRLKLQPVMESKWPEIAATAHYLLGLAFRDQEDIVGALDQFRGIDTIKAPFTGAKARQQIAFLLNRRGAKGQD